MPKKKAVLMREQANIINRRILKRRENVFRLDGRGGDINQQGRGIR